MSDPSSTHLPVLRALGKHLPIRTVSEYGCGYYSTLEFLRRESFPQLESLHSYEDHQRWIDTLRGETSDPRLHFVFVPEGQFSMQPRRPSDLVFIDSSTADSRVALLYYLRQSKLLVLHDSNGPDCYRDALGLWSKQYVYSAQTPHTAVVWGDQTPADWLRVLQDLGKLVV